MNARYDNKGQINHIFIFLVTVIMVVFSVFFVVKFLGSLNNDIGDRVTRDFLQKVELDVLSIQNEYNSENLHTYTIPTSINSVAFFTPACSKELEYRSSFDKSFYIILLDSQNQVLDFLEIPQFAVENGCIEINDTRILRLALKNDRNSIKIEYLK